MYRIPTIDMCATGKRIEELRKESKITVKQLQDVLGFRTPQAIYKWQRGKCMPTLDNLIILASIFQVRLDEIIVIRKNAA